MVEAVVEVGESCARVWPLGTLLRTVGLAGLETDDHGPDGAVLLL